MAIVGANLNHIITNYDQYQQENININSLHSLKQIANEITQSFQNWAIRESQEIVEVENEDEIANVNLNNNQLTDPSITPPRKP